MPNQAAATSLRLGGKRKFMPEVRAIGKKPIIFNSNFSVVFDCAGVYEVPSGTKPHNPEQTRIALCNCQVDAKYATSKDIDKAISDAADEGEDELIVAIQQHFKISGRAETEWNRRLGLGA